MDRLRSRQNWASFLKTGLLKTVRESEFRSSEVAESTSQSFGSISFSEAFRTIIAFGSTGWFEEFSKAAAAHFAKFSKTLSMTLVDKF